MKRRPNLMSRLFAAIVLGSFAVFAAAQDREQVERRVQSVGTLIESSSAAKQIEYGLSCGVVVRVFS